MANQERSPKAQKPLLRRILKWSGVTLLSLVALIVVALAVIPHVVNLGPVKRQIEHAASRSTGRTVSINGSLSLSLFPWVGFDARDVSMANASGFGETPFLRANELDIHVKLIPLIFRHVEISGISLDRVALHLTRKSNGLSNWRDLLGHANGPTTEQRHGEGVDLAHLSIGRVTVSDASLDYNDAQSGHNYSVTHFDLRASGIAAGRKFPLHVQMTFNAREPHVHGNFALDTGARFDAAGDAVAIDDGRVVATVSGAGLPRPVSLDARWQSLAVQRGGTARLSGLDAVAAGLHVQLDGTAKGLGSTPDVAGQLQVAAFSPRKVLARLGQPIPSRLGGFGSASLNAHYRVTAQQIDLSSVTLHLDDTTLSGKLGIPVAGPGAIRFALAGDRLDLNRYLPSGTGPAAHTATAHSERFLETRLPGRLIRNLNVDGSVTLGSLTGLGLDVSDVALALKAAHGAVTLAPLRAELYGGRYRGEATIAATGAGIRVTTMQRLAGVDAGRMIAALGGGSRLSGTADAVVRLAGSGETVGELLDTLKGNTTFALRHGAITGFNLWNQIERAFALAKGRKLPAASIMHRTEFAELQGSANIAHGVLTNDALEASLPFLTVTGHGTADLNKHYVNYDLLAKVVKTPKIAGVERTKLEGLTIPIHVSGSFADLKSALDVQAALKARAKAALEKKLEKQSKDTEKRIRSKLQELLNSGGGG